MAEVPIPDLLGNEITKESTRQLRTRGQRGSIVAQRNLLLRAVRKSLSNTTELSSQEKEALSATPDEVTQRLRKNFVCGALKREQNRHRGDEVVDSVDVLESKCAHLFRLISLSRSTVVYTGAGISTAANIPDYRGPRGTWTLLGGVCGGTPSSLPRFSLPEATRARPTYTHMFLVALMRAGLLAHVVSQNCDGLHLRSGLPLTSLSELHGNVFVEVCSECCAVLLRRYDVTERSSAKHHRTGRRCVNLQCTSGQLLDTIVHFGEKGRWQMRDRLYEWRRAEKAAASADLILCLGTSLKVLKEYPTLWPSPRNPRKRPQLGIVNLQWTPKDVRATLKINATCDKVCARLAEMLNLTVDSYCITKDPLLRYARPFSEDELSRMSRDSVYLSAEENAQLELILAAQRSAASTVLWEDTSISCSSSSSSEDEDESFSRPG